MASVSNPEKKNPDALDVGGKLRRD